MKPPSFFQRSELAATLWTFRKEFAVAVAFTAVVNVLMLTPSLYMLQVFDRVFISRSEVTLIALTLVMLFFFAVMAFADWIRSRLLVRTGVKLDERLNSRVFKASFEARLKQLERDPAQAFSDLTNIRQFMTGTGFFAFMDAPWTFVYIFVLYLLHPLLGALAIVFCLLLIAFAYLSHRLSFLPIDKANEAGAQVNSYVHSKLRNAEVIESMGMVGDLRRLWQVRHQKHLSLDYRAQDLGSRLIASTKFMRYTQQSLTLGAGALLVIHGDLTSTGAIVAANMLMGRATQPIDMIVSNWRATLSARRAYLRLEELLAENPETAAGLVHPAPQGNMRIENLVADAPGRTAPILKGLTADFPAGRVIVIIGPSGSGKSTLARALVGIWPYVKGKVLIEGEDIHSWDRTELGPYIGYLPQDIELFEGSIAENIARFGDIDPEKVILAAERAGVHDMILRFPRGYDTPMGEAGGLLSGGQKQRIGLARAMYGDPSVLVLDEPNSNLDEAGEVALVKSVEDLRSQGKTVFLITHRLHIIGSADLILVLRDGAIHTYGPREAVLAALRPKVAPVPRGDATEPPVAPQPA